MVVLCPNSVIPSLGAFGLGSPSLSELPPGEVADAGGERHLSKISIRIG